ncbi:MAG: 1-deoxy-D-xylulose-5-phosphate reductoisomerase [Candidatus Izemoplasmataceae bacterium]|jgi:1-deoxy-D-xylulose-5-phosphate reductoisomerase|uniref:1-deoxy-D-xylulose-5-phosphate reductoisomerase n=1 Tax=Liberiplasma polymorphum TaxID=3374570 RepID=UPI003774944A
MKKVVILGASGSIGRQAIDIINEYPNAFKLIGVTANHSVEQLISICEGHEVEYLALNKQYEDVIKEALPLVTFFSTESLTDFIEALPNETVIINALVGSVGLAPTISAIKRDFDILLANKETLVVGGEIIKPLLKSSKSKLIPIDSEHSALAQCLQGHKLDDVEKIIITASGGSFRDLSKEALKQVTVEDALKHPNWSMGAKITIDSATMMNKVFEVIEAHYLFDLDYSQIEAIIHKESVIHGMVYYKDGNVLAHLGPSDMHIPILTALQGVTRLKYPSLFDLTKFHTLHFEAIDPFKYPLFDLGMSVAKKKGLHIVTLNAANEEAVALFLNKKIPFLEIETIIIECLNHFDQSNHLTLEKILAHDQAVRKFVHDKYLDGE